MARVTWSFLGVAVLIALGALALLVAGHRACGEWFLGDYGCVFHDLRSRGGRWDACRASRTIVA